MDPKAPPSPPLSTSELALSELAVSGLGILTVPRTLLLRSGPVEDDLISVGVTLRIVDLRALPKDLMELVLL